MADGDNCSLAASLARGVGIAGPAVPKLERNCAIRCALTRRQRDGVAAWELGHTSKPSPSMRGRIPAHVSDSPGCEDGGG